MSEETKGKQGFASMDRKLVSEIASKGGKAAHAHGRAHEFTSDEARAAGKLGGDAIAAKKGKEYFAQIGRAGGKARGKNQAEKASRAAQGRGP